MTKANCLCGDVTWEMEPPFELMSHCHWPRRRKSHGSAFATYVAGPAENLRVHGKEHIGRFESIPGFFRCFCTHCGSVVPGEPFDGQVFVPVGNFIDDPGSRALA